MSLLDRSAADTPSADAAAAGAARTHTPAVDDPLVAAHAPEQEHEKAGPDEPKLHRSRSFAAWTLTVLAGVLLLVALVGPNESSRLTLGAFARIPAEALLGVALLLTLPRGPGRVVAALVGAGLGLLIVVKVLDMGFHAVFARPYDLVLDWVLFDDALSFLTDSIGRAGAVAAAVGAAMLAVALLVLATLSAMRVQRLVARRGAMTAPVVALFATVWLACASLGAQLVPDAPIASTSASALVYDRAMDVRAGIQDQRTFAAETAVDAFRGTPSRDLLTALRGKDVVLTFVESYGRDAVEDPQFAAEVGAVLEAGDRRLGAAGFSARSAFLTSPTIGGGSWLAHATLLSGLWIDNDQRYRSLLASDRLTLNGAFQRANWRTVGVMPAITEAWPEGKFYGYDQLYDSRNLGYRGPKFSYATMPDQYTLAAFERLERGKPDQAPLMAEIPLVSSHGPWTSVPRLIKWDQVGDGSIFGPMEAAVTATKVVSRETSRVRADYRRSIEYSLETLISYVETYGDDDLVLVFLGDHQPAPVVTGAGASWDVPITIVTREQAVLDRITGWKWEAGLRPSSDAPVWPMNAFRDRFLTAFAR